eukprot:INCI137.1.p1 GENE.INCI137.1~~INCI137.1.p1  ORF type:complete len:138 (+),score=24.94 INCI137.1:46-414(+)
MQDDVRRSTAMLYGFTAEEEDHLLQQQPKQPRFFICNKQRKGLFSNLFATNNENQKSEHTNNKHTGKRTMHCASSLFVHIPPRIYLFIHSFLFCWAAASPIILSPSLVLMHTTDLLPTGLSI